MSKLSVSNTNSYSLSTIISVSLNCMSSQVWLRFYFSFPESFILRNILIWGTIKLFKKILLNFYSNKFSVKYSSKFHNVLDKNFFNTLKKKLSCLIRFIGLWCAIQFIGWHDWGKKSCFLTLSNCFQSPLKNPMYETV